MTKQQSMSSSSKKHKITLLLCTLTIMCTVFSCAAAPLTPKLEVSVNDPEVFVRQQTNYTCTLASAEMMLRRAAILANDFKWNEITEYALRKYAWQEGSGLLAEFSYKGMSVSRMTLPGGNANRDKLISILKYHPEGVALYNRDKPHAILLCDYTDGVFYIADPGTDPHRKPISESRSVSIENADCIWYISANKNVIPNIKIDEAEDYSNENLQPTFILPCKEIYSFDFFDSIIKTLFISPEKI